MEYVAATEIQVFPVGTLTADGELDSEAYQRSQQPSQTAAWKHGYDPKLYLPFIVSARTGNIIDGGGRYVFALATVGEDVNLPTVYVDVAPAEEADLFVKMNKDKLGLKGTEIFGAAVASGDEDAVAIDAAVKEVGLSVSRRGITATAPLYDAHQRGVLDETLRVLTESGWHEKQGGLNSAVISAISNLAAAKRFTNREVRALGKRDPQEIAESVAKMCRSVGGSNSKTRGLYFATALSTAIGRA